MILPQQDSSGGSSGLLDANCDDNGCIHFVQDKEALDGPSRTLGPTARGPGYKPRHNDATIWLSLLYVYDEEDTKDTFNSHSGGYILSEIKYDASRKACIRL